MNWKGMYDPESGEFVTDTFYKGGGTISQSRVDDIKREQDYDDQLRTIPFCITNHLRYIEYLRDYQELGVDCAAEIDKLYRRITELRQELVELKASRGNHV